MVLTVQRTDDGQVPGPTYRDTPAGQAGPQKGGILHNPQGAGSPPFFPGFRLRFPWKYAIIHKMY